MKLEFSRQIYENKSNIKFHENPFVGSQIPSGRRDGQADKRDEANSRFSQFCNAPESGLCCSESVSVIILWGRWTSTDVVAFH